MIVNQIFFNMKNTNALKEPNILLVTGSYFVGNWVNSYK